MAGPGRFLSCGSTGDALPFAFGTAGGGGGSCVALIPQGNVAFAFGSKGSCDDVDAIVVVGGLSPVSGGAALAANGRTVGAGLWPVGFQPVLVHR